MSTSLRNKAIARIVFVAALLSAAAFTGWQLFHAPKAILFAEENTRREAVIIQRTAENLIVQQFIVGEGLYATRGYDIYFLAEDATEFTWKARLPVPLGLSFIGHSNMARNALNREEVTEMRRLRSGSIVAFAGGHIFRSEKGKWRFEKTGSISHFGLGKGRGIYPQGIAEHSDGSVYWGEYWRNAERSAVRIWRSKDDGRTWHVAYEFPPGHIRHVHAVQYDAHTDKIWLATGDGDRECKIGYLNDQDEFVAVGQGSQKWRAVSLVFTEDSVYWGMDGISKEYPIPVIWKYDRFKGGTENLREINSTAFYSAKSDDNMIITSSGELYFDGSQKASMWISSDGEEWIEGPSWEKARKSHLGTIRVVGDEGGQFFATMLNLKGVNNSLAKLKVVWNRTQAE